MTEPRQTLSYIQNLLARYRIQPKQKLGQNFLIDINIIDMILRAAELTRADAVLEVGTGTGSLTGRIADEAGAIVSVEIDPPFHMLAKDLLYGRANVSLLHADALDGKNEFSSAVLHELERVRQQHNCTQLKLVANLPYVVATPVIGNLLVAGVPIERFVVMVQWEIAERMMAQPSTSAYSSLAILMQSVADISLIRKLGPSVFFPKPAVDSAVVLIKPNAEKRAAVGDVAAFRTFLRDLYTHRRKNLRGALAGWPSGRRSKTDVDALLAKLGHEPTIRAETLTLAQHLELSRGFAALTPQE